MAALLLLMLAHAVGGWHLRLLVRGSAWETLTSNNAFSNRPPQKPHAEMSKRAWSSRLTELAMKASPVRGWRGGSVVTSWHTSIQNSLRNLSCLLKNFLLRSRSERSTSGRAIFLSSFFFCLNKRRLKQKKHRNFTWKFFLHLSCFSSTSSYDFWPQVRAWTFPGFFTSFGFQATLPAVFLSRCAVPRYPSTVGGVSLWLARQHVDRKKIPRGLRGIFFLRPACCRASLNEANDESPSQHLTVGLPKARPKNGYSEFRFASSLRWAEKGFTSHTCTWLSDGKSPCYATTVPWLCMVIPGNRQPIATSRLCMVIVSRHVHVRLVKVEF